MFAGNDPSCRVLEKSGFFLDAYVPARVLKNRAAIDEKRYVLSRPEGG